MKMTGEKENRGLKEQGWKRATDHRRNYADGIPVVLRF